MTTINDVVGLSTMGSVGIITVDSPPLNILSHPVREGLKEALLLANSDPLLKAIILICKGNTFIAGADITEFSGPATDAPTIFDIQNLLEQSPKITIAAIHGTALGGGLEVAMCTHFRVAAKTASCGLPEVKLGLLPGAGGTQRLPRLVGVSKALEMMTSGEKVTATECFKLGLIDVLSEENELLNAAIELAHTAAKSASLPRKVRERNEKLLAHTSRPEIFLDFKRNHAKKFRGLRAPEAIIRCVQAAANLSFEEGKALEGELFLELLQSPESAAQRYCFFAERLANKIPDIPKTTNTLHIHRVGVIGAGTMGGGIAMTFANAGLPVTVLESSPEALARGLSRVWNNYESSIKSGKLSTDDLNIRKSILKGTLDINDLSECDLVVEAAFENMEVKKEIFCKLDKVLKPSAILATNTSALDINEIARETTRAQQVLGMHFFSPAHVMRLVEVVRTDKTSKEVIATIMHLSKRINKVACLVGVTHGFVGNRMLYARRQQCQAMLLEGALPWEIDKVIYDFGFPMGPFAISDLAGLDLGWNPSESRGQTIQHVLCESGRRGQKTGAGYYDYDEDRRATPSLVTESIIKKFAEQSHLPQRSITDEEILDRCLFAMINEGAKIIEERVAIRASDIDVIWVNGYGWPVYKGGPMYYADQLGLTKVLAKIKELERQLGVAFKPAALLETLVRQGKCFNEV